MHPIDGDDRPKILGVLCRQIVSWEGERVGLIGVEVGASLKNVMLMTGSKSASTESSVVIPYAAYNYTGKGVVPHSGWNAAMPGVTAADSFTISITKGGVTTNVDIDLANVGGTLSLDEAADVRALEKQLP